MKYQLIILLLLLEKRTYNAEVNLNNNEEISVSIDKVNPTVDSFLTCSINGIEESKIEYRWTINDKVVSTKENYKTTPEDYESFINVEILKDNEVLASDSMFFSLMPVIYINTEDNQYIDSREEYKNANMYIQGNYKYESQYDGNIEIKGRGGSSWISQKKSFKLKLSSKTNLFGFGKSKHYVLLNNSQDLSLLRNKVAFDISKNLGLTTTDSELVEVIFNGDYQGCYLLCEHIRIGSSIIDIEDYEELGDLLAKNIVKEDKSVLLDNLKDYLSTNMSFLTEEYIEFNNKKYKVSDYIEVPNSFNAGFLYEFTNNNKNTNSSFITNKGMKVNVSKPEYIESNSKVFNKAKEIINDFEEAIYSLDGYNSKGKHFTELCNIDSLASYFLTFEIMGNEDAASRSRYCYINNDGLLEFGPVWDFDISSNANKTIMPSNTWVTTSTIVSLLTKQDLFKEVLDDPIFQMKVYEKYRYIKPYLDYIVKDNGLIDEYINYSYLSGIKNEYQWVNAKASNQRSYSGANGDLNSLKNYLIKRIKWLDKQLETEESTYKSLSSIYSSNHFKKNDKIKIDIKNNNEVSISLPSNYDFFVYVNGKKYTNELSFNLNDGLLNSGINTIEVLAKKNNKVIRNYKTIIKDEKTCEFNNQETICNHQLVSISYLKESADNIGRIECYYCTCCHHYFDENENQISIQKVYKSVKTKTALYGLKSTIVGCIFIFISIAILLLSIIFDHVNKARKEKHYGK